MLFKNRREAGRLLGKKILGQKQKYGVSNAVVIGMLRGGVPVAYEVALALGVPLEVAIVRKIGAPGQEELAIGAVVDGERPYVFLNTDLIYRINPGDEYIEEMKNIKLAEIREREKIYRKGRKRITVTGKTAIIVDDGIATGASIKAVIGSLRHEKPEKIVVAVPVLPNGTLEELEKIADKVIFLSVPDDFYAVGQFYADFRQTSDEEVLELLHAQVNGAKSG